MFLGYIFDYKLIWKPHIHNLRNRCAKRLNVLKAVSGIKWGCHPTSLLAIYRGYILSVLDWGGIVLTDVNPATTICLGRIQFAAIRIVLGLMKTTPTNILLDQVAE